MMAGDRCRWHRGTTVRRWPHRAMVSGGTGVQSGRVASLAVASVAAMLVAAIVVLLFARRFAERGYERQERYRRQLFDAELDALARLREAGQIRDDLIASVSHEFRTPLTAIRGSAATLATRGDRIPPEARTALLDGIVEHADRLSRLLEDMLLAASAGAPPRRCPCGSPTTWPRRSRASRGTRSSARGPPTPGPAPAGTGRSPWP